MPLTQYRFLFLYTMVAPMGSGPDGGLYRTLCEWTRLLSKHGHSLSIIAAQDSTFPKHSTGISIKGILQQSCQTTPKTASPSSALINACEWIKKHHQNYDIIINLSFDSLPHTELRALGTPVRHYISMCNISPEFHQTLIKHQSPQNPYAFLTPSQLNTFSGLSEDSAYFIKQPFNPHSLHFSAHPQSNDLVWISRISPEKGLDLALSIALKSNRKLHICGVIQDRDYFNSCTKNISQSDYEYHGHCTLSKLNDIAGNCQALIATHQWEEAFGMIFIETLAMGTPIIAHNIGSPKDIIQHNKTGFLIPKKQYKCLSLCYLSDFSY